MRETPDFGQRLRAGDESVLCDILLDIGPWAAGVLATVFGPRISIDDIDDILAQTLAKIWQHRKQYDPNKGRLGTWFLSIARNVAKEHMRLRKHVVPLDEVPVPVVSHPFDAEEAEHEPPSDPFLRDFRRVFSSLREDEQLVATYASNAYVNGCSSWTAPVCEILGIAPKHARVIWGRTKDKLRRRMRDLGHSVPDLQEQR